jgi:hypothetical protein
MNNFTRRSLFKGAAGLAGAAALSRVTPAFADPGDKPALLVVFLESGYNSLFASADSFVAKGDFGCTATNVKNLGNGLVVDDSTLGQLGDFATSHMASVGIAHGQTAHESAQASTWAMGSNRNYGLALARAMGGNAAIKAAIVGGGLVPNQDMAEVEVSMQGITDMKATLVALGADGLNDPSVPKRTVAAQGLMGMQNLSKKKMLRSPRTLQSVSDGLSAGINTLKTGALTLSYPDLCNAYNVTVGTTGVTDFNTQMMAAEVMITSGTNMVVSTSDGWDSHGDTTGASVRNKFQTEILPGLKIFCDRMLQATGRNVTVAIWGDFARSLPGSDHQGNLTATVIGKNVITGTTGHVDDNVGLPQGGPAGPEFWAYLAAVTRTPGSPFGPNPHTTILG